MKVNWDKILFDVMFVIGCFSSIFFLFSACIFFFVKDARSYTLGIIMLIVFLRMQKGDSGIKALWKSRIRLNETMFSEEKINRRYSFIKKKELSSKYIRRKKAKEAEIMKQIIDLLVKEKKKEEKRKNKSTSGWFHPKTSNC